VSKFAIAVVALMWAVCSQASYADQFTAVEFPKFKSIEPRMVYGKIVYDFSFAGKKNEARKGSAQDFLQSVIKSKFNNRDGSYIVTLEVSLGSERIALEPILSATWQSKKFLFVTTSVKDELVVNNNGIVLDGIPIDNENNQMKFTLSIFRSQNSTIDLSLFKQLSDLSANSAIAKFSPGLAAANEIYTPFVSIFTNLLSKFEQEKIVESTIGAFTLLDEGFGNVLHYANNQFSLNVYLKTENSQLNGQFSAGKFEITNHELVLASVKSGVGAARAPVIDIIASGGAGIDSNLSAFAKASTTGNPYKGSYSEPIGGLCTALKSKFNAMITTRDASLVYWAYLTNYADELQKYADGVQCARDVTLAILHDVGLDFDKGKLVRTQ